MCIIYFDMVSALLFGTPVHMSEEELSTPYYQNIMKLQDIALVIVKCLFWTTLVLLVVRYAFNVTDHRVETALLYIGTTTLYTLLLLLGFPVPFLCMPLFYSI